MLWQLRHLVGHCDNIKMLNERPIKFYQSNNSDINRTVKQLIAEKISWRQPNDLICLTIDHQKISCTCWRLEQEKVGSVDSKREKIAC